jgi:hypothetical protein
MLGVERGWAVEWAVVVCLVVGWVVERVVLVLVVG